jgi:hypothetical protein
MFRDIHRTQRRPLNLSGTFGRDFDVVKEPKSNAIVTALVVAVRFYRTNTKQTISTEMKVKSMDRLFFICH